jgi:hypothetical protein
MWPLPTPSRLFPSYEQFGSNDTEHYGATRLRILWNRDQLEPRRRTHGKASGWTADPLVSQSMYKIEVKSLKGLVGERGFEPPTPWSRTRCSTRLSHSPTDGWMTATTGTMWRLELRQYSILRSGDLVARAARGFSEQTLIRELSLPVPDSGTVEFLTLPRCTAR